MGRPSKLSIAQWEAIKTRILAGEKPADLAREFGVSKTAISVQVSKRIETVREVANKMVDTEVALRALPIADQLSAVSLADSLRSISEHLAPAANFGAATARRLAGIAHVQSAKVDDVNPEKSLKTLTSISALSKMANESSQIGLNLLAANKDLTKLANQDAPVTPVRIVVQVEDASQPEAE
ncbi:helix-turn-helix domain-containing protein [Variovorax arabinosiphilus]|uniref:helix-turn-helix domain-containing protein n=1 Tax=Variovorax arabinosiphilus TaxID=3053498 RepID=UPI0025761870|nr:MULTISPECIES: helix-turn-helix domain-containing protein [unclassified Variovorax]MDM0118436.1 helix-turn-helix domain-containing protein [Variovorax sp. J2L1-78]MDM0128861.1 helix-turn-helix domain-containing protein [Variovorax sp. J2L1-63]MDM0233353.1 helix-turn-helix domain-containing protein [Variovorax sp. J2R1-6]